MYRRWLNASLPKNSGYSLVMDGYDSQDGEYPQPEYIDNYDAMMLTGSSNDAWSDEPWVCELVDFVANVIKNYPTIRLYGVCFGHQIICRALGGSVGKNPGGWEIGPTALQTTPMGRLIYDAEKIALQQFHQDAVPLESLADKFATGELYLLASSPKTPNQGIVKFYKFGAHSESPNFKYIEYAHILTSQGHPEFDEPTITELIRQRDEKNHLDQETVNGYFGPQGSSREHEPHKGKKRRTGARFGPDYDGVLVIGKAFWEMFGVDYTEDVRIANMGVNTTSAQLMA
jgi:GMP synthase-like glutamine amidotransferase